MNIHNLRNLSIAKRNIKDIPVILASLERTKKELEKYAYLMHVGLIIDSIDEALEELGYTYLQSKEIIKTKGKI